jgi:hypothetical protein
MYDTPEDRIKIWFKLLLKSRRITQPNNIGFPKAFRISELVDIYKDHLVSVEHIVILLHKANYLVISNHNLSRIQQVSYDANPSENLKSIFLDIMFTLNLEETKKFLEQRKGFGPQLKLEL